MLPGYDKQHTTDTQASQQNIHPDIGWEGVEEGEDPRIGAVGLAVQDTYPQSHEGLWEVDDLLPYVGNGKRSNWKVCFLKWNMEWHQVGMGVWVHQKKGKKLINIDFLSTAGLANMYRRKRNDMKEKIASAITSARIWGKKLRFSGNNSLYAWSFLCGAKGESPRQQSWD